MRGVNSEVEAQVFPEWQGRPLEEVIRLCQELVEDDHFPTVHRWREQGGKVAGHFQVYVPEEIIHAAGMLPVKVRGASIEPLQASSSFGSYLCSIVKTSLEVALRGQLPLDLFITTPICDVSRNLAGIWGRNFSYPSQILYLPQNPNSSHSVLYLRGEYRRLQGLVEEIAGRRVSQEDLYRSMALFNENRALLRELYAIKRHTPWKLSIEEAYALMAVGGLIPREEHNQLLRRVLPQILERPARKEDRIRVVFMGGFCEQPPLDMLRSIGRSCYVVDDDLLIGLRWLVEDVPLEGDPLLSLAEAYIERSSFSPVQHDRRKPKEQELLQMIRGSGAQAAIITAAKMCEPGLDEQTTYAKALEEAGIPYFVSEFEENMTTFDQLEMQLETFVENILFD